MNRRGLAAAAALVLAANAWVMVDAARNRGSAPAETIELTERELRLVDFTRENTVLLLMVALETGRNFDCAVEAPSTSKDRFWEPVEAFVVLEYGAEAAQPEAKPPSPSRLVAIAAGKDYASLRQRFPDPSRFLIARALINRGRDKNGRVCTASQLLPGEIYVPLPYSRIFESLRDKPSWDNLSKGGEPRYAVTLRYGALHQPWVVSARLLK